ncbi:hypothetical protein QDY72_04255 [Kingella negevensis]|uniref:hypothetical protein n=1 Tax=Kingella negevensis TaxID=1522312 RepID=UPI00254AD633|nr:hypothetical protein [Kingella negevensis]MDK4684397.1 hypothetical protein [Kingella negevensis]MDK4707577.1 hypothetical protein [Kingella negevensis]MDK4709948.1 hypothetical protein [Kingella negevensis]
MPIDYHPKLHNFTLSEQPEYDVLFYGRCTDRREKILNDLHRAGLRVKILQKVWGEERNEHIAKAKIVLNIHGFENQPFEAVRCHYLMNNRVAIVSEMNDNENVFLPYRMGVIGVPCKSYKVCQ